MCLATNTKVSSPGFGLSEFKPRRTIADWPADVTELADALCIERFSVMGISVGGPYAAACARFIPERLKSVAIVAGVGPFQAPEAKKGMMLANRIIFTISGYVPWLIGSLMTVMLKRMIRDQDGGAARKGQVSSPDRHEQHIVEQCAVLIDLPGKCANLQLDFF